MTQALYSGHSLGTRAGAERLLRVASFNLDSDDHPILQLGKLRLREGESPAQGHTARALWARRASRWLLGHLSSCYPALLPAAQGLQRPHPAGLQGPSCTGLPRPHPVGSWGPSRTGLLRPHPVGPQGPSRTGLLRPCPAGPGVPAGMRPCSLPSGQDPGAAGPPPGPGRTSLHVQLQTRPHRGHFPEAPVFQQILREVPRARTRAWFTGLGATVTLHLLPEAGTGGPPSLTQSRPNG